MERPLTYGSLFTGIGGFDLGFDRAGMRCLWQVENDPACLRVLERHWPGALRLDDVRKAGKTLPKVDVICGGWPCQDLSVAGKRAGLKGKRSGLFHELIRVLRELRPALGVFENVPGLISSHAGHDFRVVLDSLRQCGARDICWRTLDSRYFDVAQRRERVFLVADFRGQRAAEILLERPCRCGHPPQGGKARPGVAASLRSRSHGAGVNPPGRGGEDDQNLVLRDERGRCNDGRVSDKAFPLHAAKGMSEQQVVFQETGQEHWRPGLPCSSHDGKEAQTLVAGAIQSHGKRHGHAMTTQQAAESGQLVTVASLQSSDGGADDNDAQSNRLVTHALSSEGADASEDGTGRGTPLIAFQCHGNNVGPMGTLRKGNGDLTGGVPAVAFSIHENQRHEITTSETAGALKNGGGKPGQGYPCVAFHERRRDDGRQVETSADVAFCLQSSTHKDGGGRHQNVATFQQSSQDGSGIAKPCKTQTDGQMLHMGMGVRRLMPVECLRLQAFPDWWLDLDQPLSDSTKYRMVGNAVTVNVAHWIAERLVRATGAG